MKPRRVFFLAWFVTGAAAVVGSMLGNALGRTGLMAGAVAGGVLGVWIAVRGAVRLGWLPAAQSRGAVWGGLAGFAIAAAIAVTSLHTPVTPVAACALVGAGVLLGAGAGR
jgi:hypothetical protein